MKTYIDFLAPEHIKEALENKNKNIKNEVIISECIGGCRKKYYVLKKIEKQLVTCPFCSKKYKVRYFENGKISISNLNK